MTEKNKRRLIGVLGVISLTIIIGSVIYKKIQDGLVMVAIIYGSIMSIAPVLVGVAIFLTWNDTNNNGGLHENKK